MLGFHRYLLPSINPEYVAVADDDAAEGSTGTHKNGSRGDREGGGDNSRGGPTRQKKSKLTKEEKKARQGSNKGRRFGKMRDDLELCWRVANGEGCEFGEG